MIIIGITGTNGAGKGTVVEYLVKKKGFKHFSVRNFIATEVKKRHLKVNRDTLFKVGNELRQINGPSYIIDKLYEKAAKKGLNTVIESLRNPYEAKVLKEKGAYLVAVDANTKLRYKRIVARASTTDKISYKQFLDQENREMSSEDPFNQNLKKVISMADFKLNNNGPINDLNFQIEDTLKTIYTLQGQTL